MGINTKQAAVYIRKCLIFSVRTSYKSARDHPFVLGIVFFLLLLYRLLPSLFCFMVSSSPVIVCTALLLGTLLSFGQPNIPEIEEEEKKTHNISSLQVGGIANDLVVKKDESFSVERNVENREEIVEKAAKESELSEQKDILGGHIGREVLFSTAHNEGEEIGEAIIGTSSAVEEDTKEIHSEKMTEETEVRDHGCFDELRSREVDEIMEHDVILAGISRVREDFNDPLASMLPESAIERIAEYSSSNSTNTSDDGTMDEQVSLRSEWNEKINAAAPYSDGLLISDSLASSASERAQPSPEKSAVLLSSDAGIEDCQVCILPSIPEEAVEDFRNEEEHESISTPVVNVGLTCSHIIEELIVSSSSIEQDLSFLQGHSTEHNENDNVSKLAHVPGNEDALVAPDPESSFTGLQILEPTESMDFLNLSEGVAPVPDGSFTGLQTLEPTESLNFFDLSEEVAPVPDGGFTGLQTLEPTESLDFFNLSEGVAPVPDGGFTGLQTLEPRESLDFLNLSEWKSEIPDFEANTNLTDLEEKTFIEQIEQEQEKSDVVHAMVGEIKGLDEGLLSELDAVGDFHLEELKSDEIQIEEQHQSDIDLSNDGVDSLIHSDMEESLPQLQVPETKFVEEINISPKKHSEDDSNNSGNLHSVLDQPKLMEFEVGTSKSGLFVGLLESMEFHSELHGFEARSLDDIDSVFKLLCGGVEKPISLEPFADKPVLAATQDGSAELVLVDRDPDLSKTDSDLLILETKSLEDIDSVFKQLQDRSLDKSASLEPVDKPVPKESKAGQSKFWLDKTDSESIDVLSDLQEVEARSLEDINLALKQLSEGTIKNIPELMEPKVGYAEVKETEIHFEKSASLVSADAETVVELEAGPSSFLPDETDMQIQSDLHEVEARSLEDIHLALKHLSEGSFQNPPNVMEPKVVSSEVAATERHLEPNVLDAQTAVEIELGFKEDVAREAGASEQRVEKSDDGVEAMAKGRSSVSRKSQKKEKSHKSGSSTSSSSSDSD